MAGRPVWAPNGDTFIDSPTQIVSGTFLVHVSIRAATVNKHGQPRPDMAEALRSVVDDAIRNEMMFEPNSLDETDIVQEVLHVEVIPQ